MSFHISFGCKKSFISFLHPKRTLLHFFALIQYCRVQLKCDGTQCRTRAEVKGKLANGVDSQYTSHYLGTWCIQQYYR